MNYQPQQPNLAERGKKVKNYIYNYCDLIGTGNFAKVYRGINQLTQQIVAIKLISLDELKSQRLEQLVFEEIAILQQMNHPNILLFNEALLSERNCYIVTELCNEGSLADRMRGRLISEQEINRVIVDVYQGLRYLRERGVIHRDLKPANIFIHNGKMKIADFGLAKFYKQRFKDMDIGSPQYMSPEGTILNVYSEKTDIWALGILIYEMLHGVTPFIHCRNQQELRYWITRPLPEEKWRKGVHPLLRQMVNRLLEVDQMKRVNIYQLAGEPYMCELLGQQRVQIKEKISSVSMISYQPLYKPEEPIKINSPNLLNPQTGMRKPMIHSDCTSPKYKSSSKINLYEHNKQNSHLLVPQEMTMNNRSSESKYQSKRQIAKFTLNNEGRDLFPLTFKKSQGHSNNSGQKHQQNGGFNQTQSFTPFCISSTQSSENFGQFPLQVPTMITRNATDTMVTRHITETTMETNQSEDDRQIRLPTPTWASQSTPY